MNTASQTPPTEKPLAPATGSLPRRPGAGWKQISGPVWEHTSGLRVHVLGMAMLPDGSRMTWEWRDEYAALRQQAYNTKRALMVWALSLLSPNLEVSDRRTVAGTKRQPEQTGGGSLD